MIRLWMLLSSVFLAFTIYGQERLGTIIPSTRSGLPLSYEFKEYVFSEPDDQGNCTGSTNSSQVLHQIYFSQTHRLPIDHPFFFLVGARPALFQVAVTGQGTAPDISIEGFIDGQSLGERCLKGPAMLSESINLESPDLENYFSVTIPKRWMVKGLSVKLNIGGVTTDLSSDQLNISIPTELNLVIMDIDILNYNIEEHRTPIIDFFHQEIASAIPASVVRIGRFPVTLRYPELPVSDGTEQLVRLKAKEEVGSKSIPDLGNLNALANSALFNFHRTSKDFLATVYFGNTLNLDPGGWGGGHSFVSFDYHDVTIHELGHALSLPHWGDFIGQAQNRFEFEYPYKGEQNMGDGRGASWNFIQDTYEFIDPICRTNPDRNGQERSDAMQRNSTCLELRTDGLGPWDGFGDFSAYAMLRYLIGAQEKQGVVSYRNEMVPYQFSVQTGFPIMKMESGKRIFERDPFQPNEFLQVDEFAPFPGEELLDQPVYLVYGSAHETQDAGNIVYRPLAFDGTLPPILDPTDPTTIELIKNDRVFLDRLGAPKDITLRLTYEDGSVLHAINPYHSYTRGQPFDFGAFRPDQCMWSLIVPGDKKLVRVEQFRRPLVARAADDPIEGNIMNPALNVTAQNFMNEASFQTEWFEGQPLLLGPNSIGNRVWNDLNQNGIDDIGEPGIAGVTILLWSDSDGDDFPDSEGFGGATKTDENGNYSFFGLAPGKYLAFVWFLENWEEGQPLHGMLPVPQYADPNSDIDLDNNGRRGAGVFAGLDFNDIASGIIELTESGEPLNDGDREDDYYDYDRSGNQTIDFGFYREGTTSVSEQDPLDILISPNPVTREMSIFSKTQLMKEASLWNIEGKRLYHAFINKSRETIDVSWMPSGLYIVQIKLEGGTKLFYDKILIK